MAVDLRSRRAIRMFCGFPCGRPDVSYRSIDPAAHVPRQALSGVMELGARGDDRRRDQFSVGDGEMSIDLKTFLAAGLVLAAVAFFASRVEADNKDRIVYTEGGNIQTINADGTDKQALTSDGHNALP